VVYGFGRCLEVVRGGIPSLFYEHLCVWCPFVARSESLLLYLVKFLFVPSTSYLGV